LRCYNKRPRTNNDDCEELSLLNAWAFYEHYTLPRFIEKDGQKHRSLPGTLDETSPSQLYPIYRTRETDLTSWGIGTRLYFHLLRKLSILFLFVGLFNIPTIHYFRQPEYSDRRNSTASFNMASFTNFLISGSAVCDNYKWVDCVNCVNCTDFSDDRVFVCENNTEEFSDCSIDTKKYKRNTCETITGQNVGLTWTSHIIIIVGFLYMSNRQEHKEQTADEEKISSSDYSIMVNNPPKKAFDPEIWRNFFAQFDDYNPPLVTISLNNEELLRALAQLRKYRLKLQRYLNCEGIMYDEEFEEKLSKRKSSEESTSFSFVKAFFKKFGLFLDGTDLFSKMKAQQNKVKKLLDKEYDVSRVFITMQTEKGQRAALHTLQFGRLAKFMQNNDETTPKFLNQILRVTEAREATAVRWLDLSVHTFTKTLEKMTTWVITGVLIIILFFIVREVQTNSSPIAAALVISLGNIVSPQLLLVLTKTVEHHASAGSRQLSMYLKLTVFRWLNTVLFVLINTPTTKILSSGSGALLPSIAPVFMFEMILTPFLRVLDVVGLFKKHILAPRAKTQKEMNSYFLGTPYNLAERYTVSVS